ncbi:hypothetical protein F1880_003540 [Penicillium rolfsii]|nr:hypothetical protein F1880_003540 [Penicillium rolfsii]
MSWFNNIVFPAVAFTLMGVVRLLVTLIVLVAVGITSVVRPLGVEPVFLVRSSVTKSDKSNNKETLSGVELATTTIAHRPGPGELLYLASPINPRLMDERQSDLEEREIRVQKLNDKLKKERIKFQREVTKRLEFISEQETRLKLFREDLRKRSDIALRHSLQWEYDERKRLQDRIAQLEIEKAQLKKELRAADERNSVCEQRLTEQKRENAKIIANEVEKEWTRREPELLRHAQEEKDSAIRTAKELEGQLAGAISTISDFREKAKIAIKRHDELKEKWDKYRQDQRAVAQSLQWGTCLDADNDSPIRGAHDDPKASHVAALREIDRLHGVLQNRRDTQYTQMQILREKNMVLRKEVARLVCGKFVKNPEFSTISRNLSKLTLTKNDTTIQIDAASQADTSAEEEPYLLADGSVLWSAERFQAAKTEYEEYQKLRAAFPWLQEQLEQLEVAKASEQARFESLDKERAQQLEELKLARTKYLKALEHIQGLHFSAQALQETADDANTAFEEVMKTYQDPSRYMQLVTLLAPGCKLEVNLGQLQISADIVVDGLEQTDDGMEFANELAAVRQLLGPQH